MAKTHRRNIGSQLAVLGLSLAVLCALAAIGSGPGYRAGLWQFRSGFLILRAAAFTGAAAGAIALLGLLLARGTRRALVAGVLAIAIALAVAYVPWRWKQTLDALPYIHDITTDTQDPPNFVVAARLRKESDHPVAYDGPQVAAQQQQAYPDIVPLVTTAKPDAVFAAAQKAMASMGLKTTATDPAAGRLEATDTTFWYGFTDDFVVRIVATEQGTRVDVRSKSRVGRSDLGQNAKRVRTFLAALKAQLSGF